MNRLVIALITLMMLLVAGCASTGSADNYATATDSSTLPEIAPYDDEPFEPLPDMVPADTIPADVTYVETAPADVTLADTANAATTDNNALPEIPATEDAPVEPLPAFVPAQ